jgi:hypothetical protein
MAKGFEGSLEYIRHDYDSLVFIPSGDYLVVEGTSHGKMSGKSWAGGKTPGGRFTTSSSFAMAEYLAYTSISISLLKFQCALSFNKGSSFCARKSRPVPNPIVLSRQGLRPE